MRAVIILTGLMIILTMMIGVIYYMKTSNPNQGPQPGNGPFQRPTPEDPEDLSSLPPGCTPKPNTGKTIWMCPAGNLPESNLIDGGGKVPRNQDVMLATSRTNHHHTQTGPAYTFGEKDYYYYGTYSPGYTGFVSQLPKNRCYIGDSCCYYVNSSGNACSITGGLVSDPGRTLCPGQGTYRAPLNDITGGKTMYQIPACTVSSKNA